MNNLLGLHYFQDADHYRVKDLNQWLPEFIDKGIHWLVLQNPKNRAIPEEFLTGLIKSNIQPIIQVNTKVDTFDNPEDLKVILEAYAKWGIKYVIFYDQPNLRESWSNGDWNKGDVVEQFLDKYIPLQKIANQAGLTTVFPPLQPGGDYWDTAFLKKVLKSAISRKCMDMITDFHIAISAQTFNKPVDLEDGESLANQKGAYTIAKNIQDHLSFRTSEHYSKIIHEIFGYAPKAFLFWYGSTNITTSSVQDEHLSELIQLTDKAIESKNIKPLAENVLACMIYPISSITSIPLYYSGHALAKLLRQKYIYKDHNSTESQNLDESLSENLASWIFSIDHYLLLPEYKHGVPEYILEKVRPIINTDQPTLGFSIEEASLARKVTIWNENQAFTDEQIQFLRSAGCQIEEKVINGLEIALE